MADPVTTTEADLEQFRAQWKQEVSARGRIPSSRTHEQANGSVSQKAKDPVVGPNSARVREVTDYSEELEPRTYHDLPDKEDQLRLGQDGQNHDRDVNREPRTALEHYERAVEKESQGQLGDSMKHYRTAFKLDDGVHEAYKKKHFPPSSFKSKATSSNTPNAAKAVPGPSHSSLHGSDAALSPTLRQLVDDFAAVRISPAPPPTDASPRRPSPLGELPEEILAQVLRVVALADVAAFVRLAQVCKRLAYLVLTEEAIWKQVAMDQTLGFPAMAYDFACDVEGFALEANDEIARFLDPDEEQEQDGEEEVQLPPTPEERKIAFSKLTETLLHSTYASSWRQMFRSRPRIRFNGCYISTVNYTRAGANSTNTLSWGAPVHVVTYFRYLRFFPDGSAISLLTTAEPADVVHHLTRENLHKHHGNTLPSSVMKDALRGRWRLSGPASSTSDFSSTAAEPEREGDLHIETEGVVPKYTYKLLLALSHAGKGARNNKLAWKGFWSYNRLSDDWGEFGLKNDRAFYWSRVKSYAVGMG